MADPAVIRPARRARMASGEPMPASAGPAPVAAPLPAREALTEHLDLAEGELAQVQSALCGLLDALRAKRRRQAELTAYVAGLRAALNLVPSTAETSPEN